MIVVQEKIDSKTLKDMSVFGLSKSDLDSQGYITVYHGGKSLPKKLIKDNIFFLTNDIEVAKDYAQIRKGKVFTLKVKPEDVNFNTGSYEIEFDKGGAIVNQKYIIPTKEIKPTSIINYKGYKIGDKLKKSKGIINDLVLKPKPQFLVFFSNNKKEYWVDAETIVKYENI